MFFRKEQQQLDKEILENCKSANEEEDLGVVSIKVNSKEQIYSAYSYSEDKLNQEFCDYIYDKAKKIPMPNDITIQLHSKENINKTELENTLKKHYSNEYRETKNKMKHISVIALIMTLLGVGVLAVLLLLNHFFNNFYVTTVLEIAAWVFIWEAVDFFFLQRPTLKAKCLIIQKIYSSKIELSKEWLC